MKNKAVLYSLAVIILDLIALVSVIRSGIDPSKQEYKNAIESGKQYEEQNLCEKAIQEYYHACQINDSEELRMKIADLYEKGYENGEFSSLADRNNVLDSIINDYPNNSASYDILIEYYDDVGDNTSCAKYVKVARKNDVSTEIVNNCYDKIRHLYKESSTAYDSLESFGTFIVAKRAVTDKIEKYDKNGEIITTTNKSGETEPVTEDREYTEFTYIFPDGTMSEVYSVIDMSPPSDVSFGEKETHKMYYCKKYGNDLVAGELSNEIYSSIVIDGVRQCYIGKENEYEAVSPYSYGLLVLKNTKTGQYSIFNSAGKSVADGYNYFGMFSDSVAFADDGVKSIVDTSNEKVIKDEIEDVILAHGGRCSISNRMFIKYKGSNHYTMFNTESREKINFECEDADLFLDSYAAFSKNGKWGFVSDEGKVFIEPKYDQAKSFSNGFAAIKQNGKWGFIDKTGEVIIEPQFDDVLYFDTTGTVYVYSNTDGWKMIKVFYTE